MTEPIFDQALHADLRKNIGDDQLRLLLNLLPSESMTCLAAIRQALAEGDLGTARDFAHRLKGVAANIGARKVSLAAQAIETQADTLEAAEGQMIRLESALEETRREIDRAA